MAECGDVIASTLAAVDGVIRAAWDADTCDPVDLADWSPDNPARGQCGVTALVLHDLFGGDLVLGEVRVDGVRTGHHWWNRFGPGIDVDLTREQFRADEVVTAGRVVERPARPPRRCRAQYELLRDRVIAGLRAT
jgi:hypothetical protein